MKRQKLIGIGTRGTGSGNAATATTTPPFTASNDGRTSVAGSARNSGAAARASTCGPCGYAQAPWPSQPAADVSAGGQYGHSWPGCAGPAAPADAMTHGIAATCSQARQNSASTPFVRTRWRCLTQSSPNFTCTAILWMRRERSAIPPAWQASAPASARSCGKSLVMGHNRAVTTRPAALVALLALTACGRSDPPDRPLAGRARGTRGPGGSRQPLPAPGRARVRGRDELARTRRPGRFFVAGRNAAPGLLVGTADGCNRCRLVHQLGRLPVRRSCYRPVLGGALAAAEARRRLLVRRPHVGQPGWRRKLVAADVAARRRDADRARLRVAAGIRAAGCRLPGSTDARRPGNTSMATGPAAR